MIVQLSDIKPAPHPVRSSWDADKLDGLVQSIAEHGLLVPVKLRPADDGYEIVFGARRIEAIRRLGWTETDAIVEGVDEATALIQALIENVQREDMNPLDQARALKAIQDQTGWSQRELSGVGIMTPARVQQLLALLDEPKEIRMRIQRGLGHPRRQAARGTVTEKHARQARRSGLPKKDRVAVIKKVEREDLTSQQTRIVADALTRETDPTARRELLEQPYRGHERMWEARAKEAAEETHEQEWPEPEQLEVPVRPEFQAALDFLNRIEREQIPGWERMVADRKISPEGVHFLILKLRRVAAGLQDLASRLEARVED